MEFSILNKSGEKLTMSKAFKRAILRILFLLTIPLAVTSCGSEQFAGGGIGGTGIYAGDDYRFWKCMGEWSMNFSNTGQSSITVDDDDSRPEYTDEKEHLKIGMYVNNKRDL